MTDNRQKKELEDFKYLIDSRHLTNEQREEEKSALLKAREARFRIRPAHEIREAKLMQLRYQMEEYLNKPESNPGPRFPEFLRIYVDTLHKKRKEFAADLSIKPIILSQVLNRHREPQEVFLQRLILHSANTYQHIGKIRKDLWLKVYYQDKLNHFLSTQDKVQESQAKYVTNRRLDP